MAKYILALDQGTTSSRALLIDRNQKILASAQKEFPQYYPQAAWVEQDPKEIFSSQYAVMNEVIASSGVDVRDIAAIGIANQRETTILWDKHTGLPIYNAIVWQCRRTADIIDQVKEDGHSDYIQESSGLIPDAYFSASKIKWILDRVPGARTAAARGDVLFGTVDSWLLWQLTDGAVHATDYTNASRTMIYNIRDLSWDDKLLEIFDIPRACLPEVRNSSEIYGFCNLQGHEIPIAGMAGDQQAALFGQRCFNPGQIKNTYGTGCFLLMNTGTEVIKSTNGLIITIASSINNEVSYALEGSIFVAGAVIQWLRDEMGFFKDSADSEELAKTVEDNGGIYFVPAFTGLGAPHWDPYARGLIIGLTRGSKKEHITRAALESIAYQTYDLVSAMEKDSGIDLQELYVDGGAAANDFLMQFQSDVLNLTVHRPLLHESTALGAYYLAGLAVGWFRDREQIANLETQRESFSAQMAASVVEKKLISWHEALKRSQAWAE
ncbi:MAG: glycerol kinase GlpK [Saccharofermentanales bacterium]